MNSKLSRAFTREEVVFALKQLQPTKSPGPDNMLALFFQKYWSIVGTNVLNVVLNVLNSGMSLSEINRTNIALVPKTNNPQRMTDVRTISLCNVVYKLISKTLANHLKAILPHIITEIKVLSRLIGSSLTMSWWRMRLCTFLKQKKGGNDSFMAT